MNFNDTDIINNYLEGDMDNDMLQKFNQELSINAELAEEVEWHKNLKEAVFLVEKEHLRQRTKKLIEEAKKQESNQPKTFTLKTLWKSNSRYLAIAAILLLTLALAFLFYPSNNNFSNLTAQYLETPYSAPVVIMGGNAEKELWQKATSAYQQKNYEQTIELLSQMERSDKLNTEQKFYLGLAYLYQKKKEPQKVAKYLEMAKKENPTLYEESSNWYIALGYLKAGENQAAKKYLHEIIEKNAWKSQEAQELLKGL